MVSVVETVMATVRMLQSALLVLTGLDLPGYMWPQATTVQNATSFDFIVVGAGSGGSVIAKRLVEVANFNVLLIEAGGNPPIESVLPGIFTLLPDSSHEYNFTSENDHYTLQNLKNGVAALTVGKMLGGSSSLHHMIHERGNKYDYQLWQEATGDDSWSYDNLLPYFIKSETVEDEAILNSRSAQYCGTSGPLRMSRQPSSENDPIFKAYNELGYKTVLNSNAPQFTLGISEPLLTIADGKRQSGAEYLRGLGDRSNFHLLKNTKVTKVLFDENKNAIGVEASNTGGETVTYTASREVILAAGALVTPQLLMLSGVGPADHLESFDISVISDLPVGQNLRDHASAMVVHTLAEGNAVTAPANPHLFPTPVTTAYSALNISQGYSDYQTINLIFPPGNTAFIQLCSAVFHYKNEVCQAWYDGGAGRSLLFTAHILMHPFSNGEVLLKSADPDDAPLVRYGSYSNSTDLHNMVLYLQDFARIVNTTAFKEMGSSLVEPLAECAQLESGSLEYWRCYALGMSATVWHYSSTCAVGRVLDARLHVRGVQRLRVADASAMPALTSGKIGAAVIALAERGADLIKQDYGVSIRS